VRAAKEKRGEGSTRLYLGGDRTGEGEEKESDTNEALWEVKKGGISQGLSLNCKRMREGTGEERGALE